MEDGQKIDINLESPLDTKSSDMLVSVNNVKFAHNRQKYQGHVLPTSLRYEADGWAAGWYVYNFEIGGGYIFSTNETDEGYNSKAQWLAARRSKVNTTPTYVFDFHIANFTSEDTVEHTRANIKQDADAVNPATQFKAWYNGNAYINARECKEAHITKYPVPILSINYAVDGTDYQRKFTFEHNPAHPERTVFTPLTSAGWDADLTMEYLGHDDDGLVTARLTNNEVSWVDDVKFYIPKDLKYKDEVFATFENFTGNIITWKLGQGRLTFDSSNKTFYYYKVYSDSSASATKVVAASNANTFAYTANVTVRVPFSYDVPFHKYYYNCYNAVWSIQGAKTIFEDEDPDDPSNWFDIDISYISRESAVWNGDIATVGLDGPDFLTNSTFVVDFEQFHDRLLTANGGTTGSALVVQNTGVGLLQSGIMSDRNNRTQIVDFVYNTPACVVPVLTGQMSDFMMPNESTPRNVTIQVYYKYPGKTSPGSNYDINTYPKAFIGGASAGTYKLMPMTYPNVAMGKDTTRSIAKMPEVMDIVFGDSYSGSLKYTIDGAYHAGEYIAPPTLTDPTQVNAAIAQGRTYLAWREIIGRKATFAGTINKIDGADVSVNVNIESINTNFAVIGDKSVASGKQYIQNRSGESGITSTEFEAYHMPSGMNNTTIVIDNIPKRLQFMGAYTFDLSSFTTSDYDYDDDGHVTVSGSGTYISGSKGDKYAYYYDDRLTHCYHYVKIGQKTYQIYDPNADRTDPHNLCKATPIILVYVGMNLHVYTQYITNVDYSIDDNEVVHVNYNAADAQDTGLTISAICIEGQAGRTTISASDLIPTALYVADKGTYPEAAAYKWGFRVARGTGHAIPDSNNGSIFIPLESLQVKQILSTVPRGHSISASFTRSDIPSNIAQPTCNILTGASNLLISSVQYYFSNQNNRGNVRWSDSMPPVYKICFSKSYPTQEIDTGNRTWTLTANSGQNLSVTFNLTVTIPVLSFGDYIYDIPPGEPLGFIKGAPYYWTHSFLGTSQNTTELFKNVTLFKDGTAFCVGFNAGKTLQYVNHYCTQQANTADNLTGSNYFVTGHDVVNYLNHHAYTDNPDVAADMTSRITGSGENTKIKVYSKERLMIDGDIAYIGEVPATNITAMSLIYGSVKLQLSGMSNFGNGQSVIECYTAQTCELVGWKNQTAVLDANNNFTIDIIDNNTGELLINHEAVVIQFSEGAFTLHLNKEAGFVGALIHSTVTTNARWTNLSGNVRGVQQLNTYGIAYMPIQKEINNASGSIYSSVKYGGSQGIAIFDAALNPNAVSMASRYNIMMLSPLNKYRVAPRIDTDNATLTIYSQKAYTHAIGFDLSKIPVYHTRSGNNYPLLDDTCTDLEMVTVGPRSSIFTSTSYDVEVSNKLYFNTPLLEPASIAFYNKQMHIIYQPRSGNGIMVAGVLRELSASNLSIKQTVDLSEIYLPTFDFVSASKYNYYTADTDEIPKLEKTKKMLGEINNIAHYYANAYVQNINFNAALPTVQLYHVEYKSNVNSSGSLSGLTSSSYSMYYTGKLDFGSDSAASAHVNSQYTDENKLIVSSYFDVSDVIHLPGMPGIVPHDIPELGKITYTVNNNSLTYNYFTNTVESMIINNKPLTNASVQLADINTDAKGIDVYSISINQSLNTLVTFKHVGIYKVSYTEFTDNTADLDNVTYNDDGIYSFNVIKLLDTGSALSTPIRYAEPKAYNFNLAHFDDPVETTPKFLDYTATDVRDDNPATRTKHFARVLASDEYQLIKQHWDPTVAVENFWWVDKDHVLALTKDKFILRAKTDGYDDWMGDNWYNEKEFSRTDYLTSDADTAICSSAVGKNVHSYLYTLCVKTANSIEVKVYDPLDNMSCQRTYIISFEHVALGRGLYDDEQNTWITRNIWDSSMPGYTTSECVVNTYSDILASSLLTDSKISAVELDGYHWLGIQYDKNFNQWSFGISVDPYVHCKYIHGYGCVGVNGYATGGMMPSRYFNTVDIKEDETVITNDGAAGFFGVVHDVNKLEDSEDKTLDSLTDFNKFDTRIVGDENQQWYICDELKDIVMAVSLEDVRKFIILPITNNYAQIYSSPSYAKYTVHALGLQIKQLVDMLPGVSKQNNLWQQIIKYALFPVIWYLSPYTNVINYLQQTLGQYAYVHYNSTSIGKKGSVTGKDITDDNAGLTENEKESHIDALLSDDLSFDVQHIPQEQSFRDNGWENVLGILASMVVQATDYTMQGLTVNQLQNQSAVTDMGRKFSQAFLQNIGSMSVTGFNMQSTKPMLKSEVTAVKTLDMFYSTSAQQNCYAGPGFVNMQFVAQCTAQSVTSVQLEAQQTQMFVLLRQLTTWQGKCEIFLLDLLKDFLFKQSDNVAYDVMGSSPGIISGVGWIAAIILSALGYAIVAVKALVKLGIEAVDAMLESFFPDGIKTNVTAQLSRHNYDIEGKHAYGNKSECFMWPCMDCNSKLYTDEKVEAVLQDKKWPLEMPKATFGNSAIKTVYENQPECITLKPAIMNDNNWDGEVPYSIAMCKGKQSHRSLPADTAFVIGTESFMPTVPFKNENIGEGEPIFAPPPVQDYLLNKDWNIFVTAIAGDALWVSCKDTKLFDGNYSNIVISDDFCGIAAPHIAVEVKRNICEEYLRPWAVSPDAIALNITGLNCAYEEMAYHAFDGYGYRITDWVGSSGLNKEHYTLQYCFQINDRFKRSNKLPPNQFMGNFQAVPSMSLDVHDKIFNDIQVTTEGIGLRTGVTGENKDTHRYSLPIFTEQISSLPAIVRALSPYKLAVIDGITSLTTDVRVSQSAYKMPVSVDFNINDKLFRMTNEYICSVEHDKGLEIVKYLVPALGLTYLGATPFMAYFYNQATRQYYIYQGGNTLQVIDMLERFRDIKAGIYDFINQEVVMPCLATLSRLDKKIQDDADETDNIVIPVFRHNNVGGEITPPHKMIFNTRSWFKTISVPAGLVFQGPNRCIINRFVWSQYMLNDIKSNKGKWVKLPREEYHPFRDYGKDHEYESILKTCTSNIRGWTHNPFVLVTSPIGVNEQTDCKFEWEITFAWTTEMEQLYEDNEYVAVNIMAETMCPGGKKFSRPTHIYLHKELFTRTGNVGYYSFRYQSNNGAGNRERLHIWSDGYIAVSSLQLEYKVISEKRNEILVTQEDIKGMKEM